jgi:N-acetylglucosaminyl-diphospho-decaprenol L-rhamnosyltransferase
MPSVSLIIVTWNAAKTLPQCVKSLAAQEFKDWELIIVDNDSHDNSANEAHFTALMDQGIAVQIFKRGENTGFAAGVNFAAQRAKGELLALLNPDAYPAADWLSTLVHAANLLPNYDAFGSVQIDAQNPELLDGLGDVYHASGIAWRGGYGHKVAQIPPQTQECFAPCAAAALYRKARFLDLGGFDESFFCYHEDVDFGFRLRLAGGRASLVPQARVLHEGSASTGRRSEFTVYHGTRNRVRTFIKDMPGLLFWPLLPVHIFANLILGLRSFSLGVSGAFWRGLRDGFFASPQAWRDRGKIQRHRKTNIRQIAKAFSWSPIALLKREADLRALLSNDHLRDD